MRSSLKALCSTFALVAALAAPGGPARAAGVGLVDGLWVMKQVDEVYEGDEVQEDLRLTLERTAPTANTPPVVMEVRWLKKNYGREKGLIVHFLAPAYAAGVTLNMRIKPYVDDDRWLYFPEVKAVRRIAAADRYSNFMGTDFSYYDLSEREPDEENHTLLRIEQFQGKPCYVVETTPKDPQDLFYARKVTWVDKDRFLKLRIEYYNKQGKLKKQYDAGEWQKIDGVWTAGRLVMDDVRDLHRTTIVRSNVRYNRTVGDEFFRPQNIDRVTWRDGGFALLPYEERPTRVWEGKARRQRTGGTPAGAPPVPAGK
jgi:outer membrane lipoprotein-sorting protein